MGQKLIEASLWLLATALVALLTHLSAILILPAVATRDAAHRLDPLDRPGTMALLPQAAPGSTLVPFRDPTVVQGACFFDLATSPVRLKTTVAEGRLTTLSFRTREGQVFYAMTDRAALRGTIDIRLVSEAQLRAVEAGDEEDQGLPTELRLKAPSQRGLIIASALIARPGDREEAEASIKAIACHPEAIAAPAR